MVKSINRPEGRFRSVTVLLLQLKVTNTRL